MLWLRERQGRQRSAAIRDTLRAGIEAGRLPERELQRLVKEAVRSALSEYVLTVGSSEATEKEPPRAAAALDSLEKRLEGW